MSQARIAPIYGKRRCSAFCQVDAAWLYLSPLFWSALMTVSLTPAALERVQRFVQQTPGALGLRFGVTKTGCSGWGHITDLAREARDDDAVFEQGGVRIFVDPVSLPLVDGTCIDFGKHGLSETFTFSNPNATAECGCGESFTTADEHR
ncbi:hypothetical protein XOO2417 [Xanthomonas oryzae pv. oryzae KACC 10331]|uniref:Core domain-containing protein n=5 Tax=Xanthomonas oryzae TaxID=347 RepID=Q5H050_XANOR|nr:hypothetical protein XOO2417 [Xanthomonas oryzae pv. oryzae KACC 10331]